MVSVTLNVRWFLSVVFVWSQNFSKYWMVVVWSQLIFVLGSCSWGGGGEGGTGKHRTHDWTDAGLIPGRSRIPFSRVNCQCYLVSFPPPHITAVACKRPWSFCQSAGGKLQLKHAHSLDQMNWKQADYAVQSVWESIREMSSHATCQEVLIYSHLSSLSH